MDKLPCSVEVKSLPACNVAFARHVGPYHGIGEAFERLYQWAGPRNLISAETVHLATYHDDPDTTPPDLLRSSACISIPEGLTIDGDIGKMEIPGGLFATARFEIEGTQFGAAWAAIMDWIAGSPWEADNRLCYEMYMNDPQTHPQKKFIVDICQPVRRR